MELKKLTQLENDNGHKLIKFCENYGLKIVKSFFRHREVQKYTYKSYLKNVWPYQERAMLA